MSAAATLDDDDDELVGGIDPTTLTDDQWSEMVSRWDPRNSDIAALDGYSWFGRYSFLCFGPVREKVYFSPLLLVAG